MKILTNGYKHCILAGENYMECQYLEKTRETKKIHSVQETCNQGLHNTRHGDVAGCENNI